MAAKRALITGITGQDGSYLAELLLRKNYKVHGIVRRSSSLNTPRLDHIYSNALIRNPHFDLDYGDLTDTNSIYKILEKVQPDEVYNLGAQSHVRISFDLPEYTGDVTGIGPLRVLEAIKTLSNHTGKKIKFYQASSSELFGKVAQVPQNEETPFYPRSPYGCAKLYAYWITKNYRESYGLFACNGILFNHESPRRGETFVTRKITRGVARIMKGIESEIYLGNLDAKRDWGFAGDYVEAMWLMLQQDNPEDYVIATGEAHSVREFLEETFRLAGIEIISNGKKEVEEEYTRKDNGNVVVKIDPRYFRPAEVDLLLGESQKAKLKLGWKPKVYFKELVKMMLEQDVHELKRELYGKNNGN